MQGALISAATLLFAQSTQTQQGPGGLEQMVVPFLIMIAILYLIVLRPQAKERKRHDEMISALKRGDEVVTTSGMIGTVADMADPLITVEFARNVKIRVLKSSIARRFEPKKSEEEKDTEKS